MKTILAVDDDQDVAETIQDIILSFSQHKCDYVTSGLEAVRILKNKSFDLVITDLLMPEMNGIELIDQVVANFPETKILAYSGGGSSGAAVAGIILDQAMEEGADNALLKPFRAEELIAKITDLIG